MKRHSLCFFFFFICSLGCLTAGSYVPIADADLVDQTPLILRGRILDRNLAPGSRPSTDYRVAVTALLKGSLSEEVLTVRIIGGLRPDDIGLLIFGAPQFVPEDDVLLFLTPKGDGTYLLQQFALGAFKLVYKNEVGYAVRDLTEFQDMSEGMTTERMSFEQRSGSFHRRMDYFLDWIADRAANNIRQEDYWDTQGPEPAELVSKRAEFVLFDCPATCLRGRWFEMVTQTVAFFAHVDGQDDMPGGGFAQVESALNIWKNDPGSGIDYTYFGTTTATGGLGNDGVTAILFNDPNNEIGGSYDCASGGVLAQGGSWVVGPSQLYMGQLHYPMIEGNVVIQDGAGCFLSGNNNLDGEEVFTHEIGHTLGFGHTCIAPCANPLLNEAIMRDQAHGDGRGGAINEDDELAAATLYLAVCVDPPLLNTQPVDATACVGSSASFSVTADTTGTVTWQWQRNMINVPSGVNATLNLTSVTLGDAGGYRCVVTDECGEVTSDPATLTVWNGVSPSNAGSDQLACGPTTLEGNTPSMGGGQWYLLSGSGGVITSPTSPSSGFSGQEGETYVLEWRISAPSCSSSSDFVEIKLPLLDLDGIPGISFSDFLYRLVFWPDTSNPDPNLDVDDSGSFDVLDLVLVVPCFD